MISKNRTSYCKSTDLNVGFLNVCSLRKKVREVRELMSSRGIHVMALRRPGCLTTSRMARSVYLTSKSTVWTDDKVMVEGLLSTAMKWSLQPDAMTLKTII